MLRWQFRELDMKKYRFIDPTFYVPWNVFLLYVYTSDFLKIHLGRQNNLEYLFCQLFCEIDINHDKSTIVEAIMLIIRLEVIIKF